MKSNLILGGGASGSALAFFMQDKGISYTLLEASKELGGNARTVAFGNHKYDTGAHRLHDKIPEVTSVWMRLLKNEISRVEAPSEIRWRDKKLKFPLHPFDLMYQLDLMDLTQAFWQWFWSRHFTRIEPTFGSQVRSNYGDWIAKEFVLNYSEKLWGRSCDVLHTSVSGGRLKGLNFKTLVQELFGKKGNHLDGAFYYPHQGIGQLFHKIEERLENASVTMGAKVKEIQWDSENNVITSLIYETDLNRSLSEDLPSLVERKEIKVHPNSKIWNTLPLPVFIRLMKPSPPQELMDVLDRLQFRHLGIVIVKLSKDKISDKASLYFPGSEYPFTRLYEPSNRSSVLSPKGETLALAEIGLDKVPTSAEVEAYQRSTLDAGIEMGLWKEAEIMEYKWDFLPYAYPIPMMDTPRILSQLQGFLDPIGNLFHLGRGAEFQYTHLHDHFAKAMEVVANLD